jgi:hypothetical protein
LMQPGQSVAQKLISVILPIRFCEVIFSPVIVVRFKFLIDVVCRLKNKSTATKAISKIDVILLFFNLIFFDTCFKYLL